MHIDGFKILCDSDLDSAIRNKFNKIAIHLRLSEEIKKVYMETISDDVQLIKQGRKPCVVIAARIYAISLLSSKPLSQTKISIAADCSESGLRIIYQEITGTGRMKLNVRN